MKKNVASLLLFSLLFIGCSGTKTTSTSSSIMGPNGVPFRTTSKLEYIFRFQDKDGLFSKTIKQELMTLEKKYSKIILVFEITGNYYRVSIVPNPRNRIQNFNIKNTNRYMVVNDKSYLVLFDFDYKLGVKNSSKKHTENDTLKNAKRKNPYKNATHIYYYQYENRIEIKHE